MTNLTKPGADYTYDEIIAYLEANGYDINDLKPEDVILFSDDYRRPSELVVELPKHKANSRDLAERIARKKAKRAKARKRSKPTFANKNWQTASVVKVPFDFYDDQPIPFDGSYDADSIEEASSEANHYGVL